MSSEASGSSEAFKFCFAGAGFAESPVFFKIPQNHRAAGFGITRATLRMIMLFHPSLKIIRRTSMAGHRNIRGGRRSAYPHLTSREEKIP